MAGLAKPLASMIEASYRYIGGLGSQGSQGSGLFDGTQTTDWNTVRNMYWYGAGTYVEFELYQDANLWRSGNGSYLSYNAKLNISKWNDQTNAYVDITNSITQNLGRISHTQWELYIEKLEAGKYRFSYNSGLRLDSEWFFERAIVPYHFIKNITTAKTYTIKDNVLIEVLDFSTDNIRSLGMVPGMVFTVSEIDNYNDLIGDEFEIISYTELDEVPEVIIETQYLDRKVIYSNDIPLIGVETINSINITSSGTPKHSFSFDGGISWKKYDGIDWVDVIDENDGMLSSDIMVIDNAIYTLLRNDSNYLRIRHSLAVGDEINTIVIITNMSGEEKIADTANYSVSYDYPNREIKYTIRKNGTYTVNYLDV